jgi:hypothetical protein
MPRSKPSFEQAELLKAHAVLIQLWYAIIKHKEAFLAASGARPALMIALLLLLLLLLFLFFFSIL